MNNKNKTQKQPKTNVKLQVQSKAVTNMEGLTEFFSESLSLKLLEFLQDCMQPHHKYFNIVEIAQIIDHYIDKRMSSVTKNSIEQQEQRSLLTGTAPLSLDLKLDRKHSENDKFRDRFHIQKEEIFQMLLQQIRVIFVFYARSALSYELINEYVYCQQRNILDSKDKDEEFMEIGEKRVRIDQNLKLCIMPLTGGEQISSTKIKQLVFRENQKGSELQSIYSVTKDYVRCVRIKPELIGIASDYDRSGSHPLGCWYHYETELIKPKKNTINVQVKPQEVAISSAQLKQLRASSATNLDEQFSPQLLSLLKVSMGHDLMGMISLDQSFTVQPIANEKTKINQGYVGNLQRDISTDIAYSTTGKEKYQQILLFHNYSDSQWLILTTKFMYFYRIPLPSQNIILGNQNNVHKSKITRTNPLLLLCQRLPKGCIRAIVLQRPFICLMLENNAVLILKIVINSLGIFQKKALSPQLNYFKITNKIYNDIQYRSMAFNPFFKMIFLSDFGAYLIRIGFNSSYGDIEEEGITHNRQQNDQINKQMISNSYSQLKLTKSYSNNNVIHEQNDEDDGNTCQQYITVTYPKEPERNRRLKEQHLLSVYKKQSKSPHTVVIKNQTRQVITHLTTSSHFTTLVTYESQTYEKAVGSEFQGETFRQWGNRNKIKLWDIRHMTIYQVFDVSIEVSFLQLRANGLFAVTADKGYLGFYPFNQDRKALIGKSQQQELDRQSKEITEQLNEEMVLDNSTLYFSTLVTSYNRFNHTKSHRTSIYQLKLQKYPNTSTLQTLPNEITSLAVNNRLYVLQNSSEGVEASQLHIYNRMGLKEQMVVFSNRQDIDVATGKVRSENYNQEYKHLRRIEHQQFHVVLWNHQSLKLMGANRQESLTIIFHSVKIGNSMEGIERVRNIRNIEVNCKLMVVYCENTTKFKDSAHSINSKNSKNSGSVERKSKVKGKVYEHLDYSVIIINNESDRIAYRLQKISKRVKVLHLFNTLLITKEEEGEKEFIRVLDVGQHGDLANKILFGVSFKKLWIKRVKRNQVHDYNPQELDSNSNLLIQQLQEFEIRKSIFLQQSKISVSETSKLLILLVFKVETQYLSVLSGKVVRNEIEFMVYARNISDELTNPNYKISKIRIGKKTNRNLYEYQAGSERTENIIGHKTLSIDDLYAISNCSSIDMEQLCDLVANEGHRFTATDITDIILKPNNINDNHLRDIYQILSLKKDIKLNSLYQKESNKIAALNSFAFKFLEFNEDLLNGIVAITNKVLRTIAIYTFRMSCQKDIDNQNDTYRMDMQLDKVSLLQVRSYREIQQFQRKKKEDLRLVGQQIEAIQLLEWSPDYKSSVDRMWTQTFQGIQSFIIQEKEALKGIKSSQEAPKVGRLNALKVKQTELLKRRLSTTERQVRQKTEQQSSPQGISLMFKKWSINQSIELEKKVDHAIKGSQTKIINRYIGKVLKTEEGMIERIDNLIINTQKIKQCCADETLDQRQSGTNSRIGHSLSFQKRDEGTHLKKRVDRLQNIIKSSMVAKQANLKAYLVSKNGIRTTSNHIDNKDYKLSRNDTNKSTFNEQLSKSESRNDIRVTSNSKLSHYSHYSHYTIKPPIKEEPIVAGSLEAKLKRKLEEMQTMQHQEIKLNISNLQNSQQNKSKKMSRLGTEATNNLSSPISRQKIRFATQENHIKSQSNNTPTIPQFKELTPLKSTNPQLKRKRSQIKSQHRYMLNFSLANPISDRKVDNSQRMKTQVVQSNDYAIERLKKSQKLMKDVVLPEIFSTKQKLMQKMKEKKSYIKVIQGHINDISLATLRKGEERKEIIKKLHDYK